MRTKAVVPDQPVSAARPAGRNRPSAAALALGVIGLLAALFGFGLVPSVLAIIFGRAGVSRANQRGGVGKRMAVWGIVLGAIAAVVGALIVVFVSLFIFQLAGRPFELCFGPCYVSPPNYDVGRTQMLEFDASVLLIGGALAAVVLAAVFGDDGVRRVKRVVGAWRVGHK